MVCKGSNPRDRQCRSYRTDKVGRRRIDNDRTRMCTAASKSLCNRLRMTASSKEFSSLWRTVGSRWIRQSRHQGLVTSCCGALGSFSGIFRLDFRCCFKLFDFDLHLFVPASSSFVFFFAIRVGIKYGQLCRRRSHHNSRIHSHHGAAHLCCFGCQYSWSCRCRRRSWRQRTTRVLVTISTIIFSIAS